MHILSQILVVLDQAKYQIRPGHICILINTVLNMYMCLIVKFMPYLKVLLLLAGNPLDLNDAFDGWQIKQSCMKF